MRWVRRPRARDQLLSMYLCGVANEDCLACLFAGCCSRRARAFPHGSTRLGQARGRRTADASAAAGPHEEPRDRALQQLRALCEDDGFFARAAESMAAFGPLQQMMVRPLKAPNS